MSNNNSGKVRDILSYLVNEWHYCEGGWDENDVPLGVPEAEAKLQAYISSKVNEAKINENELADSALPKENTPNGSSTDSLRIGGNAIIRKQHKYHADRIRTLKKTGGADEQEQ